MFEKDKDPKYDDPYIGFLVGGAGSNDVKQSAFLGDCWFVSALSIMSKDDSLLRGSFDF